MIKKKAFLLFYLTIITSNSFGNILKINDSIYSSVIERDQWGVPHIYGERDSDVAFGLAYAHSQDDFKSIQDIILASRGMLASVYGKEAAVNDYYVNLMGFWNNVNENYDEKVPIDVQNLCDGYASGINLFLMDNPSLKIKNFPTLNGKDLIVGFSHRMPLMFGLDGVIKKLSKEESNTIGFIDEGNRYKINDYKMVASNVFAVSPKRSSDGYTRLWINSHQPWDGPVAWYEAHLVSNEGWDFYGGFFPGSPVPLLGHNKYLGWSHTVNSPDLIDIYKLTINPENDNQYWFEGFWKDLSVKKARIKINFFGPFSWTFKREVKESIHGPVMEFDHGTYALKISSLNNLRFVEQWYRMGKAKNFTQFRTAMEIHAIPMFNTGYADKDGNIYYVYNAKIPVRDPRYDWSGYLPSESKGSLWKGYIPFNDLPQILNPPEGFFQNCNSSPYLATGNRVDIPKVLPDWTGIEDHQTNRALRSLETFGLDPSLTREDFTYYKYDVEYSRESIIAKVRDRYIEDMKGNNQTSLAKALTLIENWDLRADSLNLNAALSLIVLPNAFNENDLIYDKKEITRKLNEAIYYFNSKFGRIDVPLGQVIRLVRGETNLPLSGGPDLLRAIYFKKKEDTYQAIAGDCYFQLVEWSPEGDLNAWSIHQYGASTANKSSKHYDSQSLTFSKHQMKQIRPLSDTSFLNLKQK